MTKNTLRFLLTVNVGFSLVGVAGYYEQCQATASSQWEAAQMRSERDLALSARDGEAKAKGYAYDAIDDAVSQRDIALREEQYWKDKYLATKAGRAETKALPERRYGTVEGFTAAATALVRETRKICYIQSAGFSMSTTLKDVHSGEENIGDWTVTVQMAGEPDSGRDYLGKQ